jgi:CheY-like chemotaxis protein
MLVDDDEVDIMNIRRSFKKNNILNPLYVAHNGLEALAMLKGEGVDKIDPLPKVVLLDINMPKMNGFEFLEKIREDDELKSLSIFMLTTSNQDEDLVNAYKYNVAGYIIKPVAMQDFMASVASLNMYWQLIELPG